MMTEPLNKKDKLALLATVGENFFEDQQLLCSTPLIMAIRSWKKETLQNILIYAQLLDNETHHRNEMYFEKWLPRYLNHDFYLLFRMERQTFDRLVGEVGRFLKERQYKGGNFPIPLEKTILIGVAYLARKETILTLADRFNVACSTVHASIGIFLNIMNKHLMKKYIKWPSYNEAEKNENSFAKICGFPGVLGAIDGTHIKAKVPTNQQDSYQDRKCQHSISLQAICSSKKLFYNIASGFPGSLHDARILKESVLYKNVETYGENHFFYGKFFLIGDSAYPCQHWLITPYRDNGRLSAAERRFNTLLSKTRVKIENTFALLKGRWRILRDIDTYSIKRAVEIINTCCVLHNFCIVQQDEMVLDEKDISSINWICEGEGEDDINGINRRIEIMNSLSQSRL